jgi:hypothetical protein
VSAEFRAAQAHHGHATAQDRVRTIILQAYLEHEGKLAIAD